MKAISADESCNSMQSIEMETVAASELAPGSMAQASVDANPKYVTNRTKAIIAMNIYALLQVVFVQMTKTSVNANKTTPLDLVFILNVVMIFVTVPIIALSSQLSFEIPENARKVFFTRTTLGWILVVVSMVGNSLVPITVQQTITNTTPFWASIFAYCLVNESISGLEAASMVASFGAVVLITFSQANNDETDAPKHERLILKDNDTMAGLVGCTLIVI